jgi:hypothetical protein
MLIKDTHEEDEFTDFKSLASEVYRLGKDVADLIEEVKSFTVNIKEVSQFLDILSLQERLERVQTDLDGIKKFLDET